VRGREGGRARGKRGGREGGKERIAIQFTAAGKEERKVKPKGCME